MPAFDVLMLGIGPEGHVASIFPDSPAAHADGSVVAVRNCPKPPPTRISLTFGALQAAREVWVLASGAEKAEAVAMAVSGVSQVELPAAGARGTRRARCSCSTRRRRRSCPRRSAGWPRGAGAEPPR